jgi:hypothetical protein
MSRSRDNVISVGGSRGESRTFGAAIMVEIRGFVRLISANFHPSTTQCVVATWNREAQSHANVASNILPWKKYIEL